MIIFKEKQYSSRLDRALVSALRVGTAMEKKQALKMVATKNVYGPSAARKKLAKYAKENPGAVVGGAATVLTPVPTILRCTYWNGGSKRN